MALRSVKDSTKITLISIKSKNLQGEVFPWQHSPEVRWGEELAMGWSAVMGLHWGDKVKQQQHNTSHTFCPNHQDNCAAYNSTSSTVSEVNQARVKTWLHLDQYKLTHDTVPLQHSSSDVVFPLCLVDLLIKMKCKGGRHWPVKDIRDMTRETKLPSYYHSSGVRSQA